MPMEQVQGRQRELGWPRRLEMPSAMELLFHSQREQSSVLLSTSSEAQLGNASSEDQMEGLCCSKRIGMGKDWKNTTE